MTTQKQRHSNNRKEKVAEPQPQHRSRNKPCTPPPLTWHHEALVRSPHFLPAASPLIHHPKVRLQLGGQNVRTVEACQAAAGGHGSVPAGRGTTLFLFFKSTILVMHGELSWVHTASSIVCSSRFLSVLTLCVHALKCPVLSL